MLDRLYYLLTRANLSARHSVRFPRRLRPLFQFRPRAEHCIAPPVVAPRPAALYPLGGLVLLPLPGAVPAGLRTYCYFSCIRIGHVFPRDLLAQKILPYTRSIAFPFSPFVLGRSSADGVLADTKRSQCGRLKEVEEAR